MVFKRSRLAQLLPINHQFIPVLKSLWAIRALYFFFFAGIGAYFTFLNVYYHSIGLSGFQIGLLSTLGPFISIFSMTLWGLVSDTFGRTRLLLGGAILGSILATTGIAFAPTFAWLLPLVCLYGLFNSPIMPLIDSTALSFLAERRAHYGSLRVWGSFGFILTSTTIGFVLERLGLRAIFVGYALIMGLLLIAAIGLPQEPVQLSGSALAGLGKMLRQPLWVLFAGSTFLLGLATNGMLGFLSVAIKTMGGSESLIGLTYTMSAVAEIPIMLTSARLLQKFGAVRLLVVGIMVYALRMCLYALMPTPNWAPAINLLNGFSYGIFWISAVSYANELAPENLKTSAQGLLFSVNSLSMMVGATLSGWLFDQSGPAGMFWALMVCCLLALLSFGAGHLWLRRKKILSAA